MTYEEQVIKNAEAIRQIIANSKNIKDLKESLIDILDDDLLVIAKKEGEIFNTYKIRFEKVFNRFIENNYKFESLHLIQDVEGGINVDTSIKYQIWNLISDATIASLNLPKVSYSKEIYIKAKTQNGTENFTINNTWVQYGNFDPIRENNIKLIIHNTINGVLVECIIHNSNNVLTFPDNTPPVITLVGANPQVIELGTSYTELGATADDDSTVVINATAVDVNTLGIYNVTYNATDASGNVAIEVVRTVQVQRTTPVFDNTFDNTFN